MEAFLPEGLQSLAQQPQDEVYWAYSLFHVGPLACYVANSSSHSLCDQLSPIDE